MADEDDDDPPAKDNTALALAVQRLKTQRDQLRAQIAERDTKLAEAAAAAKEWAAAEKVAARVTAERDALVAEKSGWAEERAILGAGITDAEGIDFVRLAYSRIPAADRPKGGPAEWLQARDKLPKGVQAYLPEAKSETKAGAKPPPPNTGAKPPPNGAGGVIRPDMTMAEFAGARDSIWAELGFTAPALPKSQP